MLLTKSPNSTKYTNNFIQQKKNDRQKKQLYESSERMFSILQLYLLEPQDVKKEGLDNKAVLRIISAIFSYKTEKNKLIYKINC